MSLSLTLSNALSGLNINKQQLAVLSQNIANASTPGYTRKVLSQSANVVDGAGGGVKADEITRKVNEYLTRSVQRQSGVLSFAAVKDDYSENMQVLLGKPGAANSIDNAISNYFSTLQALADSPESATQQKNAVSAGVNLAQKVSRLADDLQNLRFEADSEINQAVRSVNTILRDLSGVNAAINSAYNLGKSTSEILDQRDMLLKDLSANMDISYYTEVSGAVNITTNTGVPLLQNSRYELDYSPQPSKDAFIGDGTINAIVVYRIDEVTNTRVGAPITLVTGGKSDVVATGMQTGKMRALLDMRDDEIPAVLEQLDALASQLRDQVNAIHNSGSPYPGAASYTGTRLISSADFYEWSGSVRIALLNADGTPVKSAYPDETSGFRPLTLNLGTLNTGDGAGSPSVQGIINEINAQFNMPQNKASLGDINNIRLVSDSRRLSSASPTLEFDFDLENIAAGDADFFVTGIQVLDNGGVDITSTADTLPRVTLDSTGTYSTVSGTGRITIAATGHGLLEGDVVYLSQPSGAINGINASEINGFFTISNVTEDGFDIVTQTFATSTGSVDDAGQTAMPKYATAVAGELTRAAGQGTITATMSGNTTAPYYTIKASVAVKNADGTIKTGVVQYRVNSNSSNMLNQRYGAELTTGDARLTRPNVNSPLLKAILVDANGVELPKVGGAYVETELGYLKIVAQNSDQVVAIDSLDSEQLGFPSGAPPREGTHRGFSGYFELNNFFESNIPTSTGDTLKGSAIRLAVESRLAANPSLISLGNLSQTLRPADPNVPPYYTYGRNSGDNGVIQQLAGLSTQAVSFSAAGGLGDVVIDINSYAAQIMGVMSTNAQNLKNAHTNQQVISAGFEERNAAQAGVNLDEELGNTITLQNAYSASARLITVVQRLFDDLISAFA